jgi:hypothetical protein
MAPPATGGTMKKMQFTEEQMVRQFEAAEGRRLRQLARENAKLKKLVAAKQW